MSCSKICKSYEKKQVGKMIKMKNESFFYLLYPVILFYFLIHKVHIQIYSKKMIIGRFLNEITMEVFYGQFKEWFVTTCAGVYECMFRRKRCKLQVKRCMYK